MSELAHDLVQRTTQGDALAVEELLRRYLPGLRAYVHVRMRPRLRVLESASDIVQSVCRELLRSLKDFDYRSEAAFKAWLYSAALHKILQHQRHYGAQRRRGPERSGRWQRVDGDKELIEQYASFLTPSREAAAREELLRVEAALDRLPDEYREVIALTKIVGLSRAEVAQQMDRSEGSVRMLLHRAMARLSTLLAEPVPGAEAAQPEPRDADGDSIL